MPHVQAQRDLPRNDVTGARLYLHLAYGGHEPGPVAPQRLDGQHEFGGGAEGIAPHLHRHRPGMACHAADCDADAALPRDRRHHADRQIVPLQHRTLLDVDLAVAKQVVWPAPVPL